MKIPTPDEAMFHGPFGDIVDQLDPHTEGSRVGVLGTLIAGFSAYLGKSTRVQTGRGLSPLSFWPVLVGATGSGRKGTATGIAMEVINGAFSAWASVSVVHGCAATGLGFIETFSDRANEDGSDPVLVIEEEMDNFVNNARKDPRVGVMLRKVWDGATIGHKSGKVDITVRDPHAAIVGHAQPINWGTISGSKDATGGTYNRFFPLAVDRSKTLPVFRKSDPTNAVRDAAKQLRRIAAFAREVDVVTISESTAVKFEEFHRPACEALIHGNDELAQMCERAMAYMVRLAALYALADGRDEMEIIDFDAALALVKYSVDTVVGVLPLAGGDRLTTKIYNALLEHGTLSKSDLWVIIGRNYKVRDIENAIKALPNVRVTVGKSTGGRPPVEYELVDADDLELAANEVTV